MRGLDVQPELYGAPRHPLTDPARPDRDAWELALFRGAEQRRMPVLAICRGLQLVNVARGGTLHQHLPEALGTERYRIGGGVFARNDVMVEEGSRLAGLVGAGELEVHSYHHQGVDRLGEGLIVTARTDTDAAEDRAAKNPGGADVVRHEDYADKSIVSLRDTLGFSPGVYLQPRFGQEVRISIRGSGLSRGYHMRGLTLLQDGVPINLADANGDFQELEPIFFAARVPDSISAMTSASDTPSMRATVAGSSTSGLAGAAAAAAPGIGDGVLPVRPPCCMSSFATANPTASSLAVPAAPPPPPAAMPWPIWYFT